MKFKINKNNFSNKVLDEKLGLNCKKKLNERIDNIDPEEYASKIIYINTDYEVSEEGYYDDHRADACIAELNDMTDQELEDWDIYAYFQVENGGIRDSYISDLADKERIEKIIADEIHLEDEEDDDNLSYKGQLAKHAQPDPLDEEITADTKFKDAYKAIAPEDYQLDKIHPEKTIGEIWNEMQQGGDVYKIASVDGEGFDSAIREQLFIFISDVFDIDYDDVYTTWLSNPIEEAFEEDTRIKSERTLDQYNDAKAYDNMIEVAGMLTKDSFNGWNYEVEDCYLDYGQKWMWTTIIAYDETGHSHQVLNPREWKIIVNANNEDELREITNEIQSDKYFQDRDRSKKESIKRNKRKLTEDQEDDEIAELQARIQMLQTQKQDTLKKEAERKAEEEKIKDTQVYKEVLNVLQSENNIKDKVEHLFDILVPEEGNAGTEAGELIRAINKIIYRSYNDGDVFYQGYGIETCGNALAYIIEVLDHKGYSIYDKAEVIADTFLKDDAYDKKIEDIAKDVLDYIFKNIIQSLKPCQDDMYDSDIDIISNLEPKYEDSYYIPSEIEEYQEAGLIDIEDELRYWEEFKGCEVSYQGGGQVYISEMTYDQFNQADTSWKYWMRSWLSDLQSEFGYLDEQDEEDDYDGEDE